MIKEKKIFRSFFIGIIIVLLFLAASYYSEKNIFSPELIEGSSFLWIAVYLLLVIIEIILGFVTVIPLIPIAVSFWGIPVTFLLTLAGWVIGSSVIFYISRKFGRPFVDKFTSLDKINKIGEKFEKRNDFIWILLLRITFPLDVISYAIALLTKVRFKPYLVATIIGFIPWTLLLTIFGGLPFKQSSVILIVGGIIFLTVLIYWDKHQK